MAGGSVTVAALRHRPRQALLVVLLSAVVTASAALGPLYARAVEQSVLKNVLAGAPVSQSSITVVATGAAPPSPAELALAVRPATPPQFGRAVPGADTPIDLRVATAGTGPTGSGEVPPGARPDARGRLVSRAGLCRHLELAQGRCVRAAGEVLVSRLAAGVTGVGLGDALRVSSQPTGSGTGAPPGLDATVVGVYEQPRPGDPYWSGHGQVAPPAANPSRTGSDVPPVDDVLTTWATVGSVKWSALRTHLDVPIDVDRVDLEGLPTLQGATVRVDAAARTVGAAATSELGPLLRSTTSQRDQARTVIPLLAVQLAVLGIVVLAFVCAAATEQRRPEIALARLRGLGTGGAAGLLVRELGLLVLLGAAVGAALGWLAALGAATLWLEDGVRLEARWPVAVAVVAAAAAGLVALLAAGAPTLRQPLTALLRRVPPRASTLQVGLVEGAVVAAAGAGVVTLLSGEGGPVALLAPGLLAIAGGLLLSQAAIPTAGPLSRRALRRGRVAPALAGVQIARRPALRRLIAIVTVACALLVFAVDAWTVSDRNRTTRAGVEAGAPVVLTVDAGSSESLRRAVLDIDPRGRFATPVVTVRSATETGPRTTAVEPEAFARIASWGSDAARPSAADLADLRPTLAAPIELRGDTVEVDLTLAARGQPPQPGAPGTPLRPFNMSLTVLAEDGSERLVDLGRVREGSGTYRAPMPCTATCRLRTVTVNRTFGDFVDAYVEADLTGLRAGTPGDLRPVDLDTTEEGAWSVLPFQANLPSTGVLAPGPTLAFADDSFGTPVSAQRGDVAAEPSALVAGDIPELPSAPGVPSGKVVALDLTAGDLAYRVRDRLPQVPRSGPRGVLVDLSAVAAGPSAAPAQTTYDVWLSDDDPARERRLRDGLADHGIAVTGRDTAAAHRAAFADEGPTLALRLAVLAGVVSVILAAAVLVVGVATSGAARARDLAGLRVVGVPAGTVRSAAVREHLVVAALGVVVGAALGVVSAQVALPQIPLFATEATRLPLALDPVWPAVLVTAAGCLVLLCAVSVVVGRLLAASATTARLREGG
jgi:putative ABC transport system permease protein